MGAELEGGGGEAEVPRRWILVAPPEATERGSDLRKTTRAGSLDNQPLLRPSTDASFEGLILDRLNSHGRNTGAVRTTAASQVDLKEINLFIRSSCTVFINFYKENLTTPWLGGIVPTIIFLFSVHVIGNIFHCSNCHQEIT